jgi:hypothetical protein
MDFELDVIIEDGKFLFLAPFSEIIDLKSSQEISSNEPLVKKLIENQKIDIRCINEKKEGNDHFYEQQL